MTKEQAERMLTHIAAECHRSKWQFNFNDESRPSASEARRMVIYAFQELHRIGDLALKSRDAIQQQNRSET